MAFFVVVDNIAFEIDQKTYSTNIEP